jgi:hypothetical protein
LGIKSYPKASHKTIFNILKAARSQWSTERAFADLRDLNE